MNVVCFVTKVITIFDVKTSRTKLVSTRSSTVQSFPLQLGFHGKVHEYLTMVLMIDIYYFKG